jgi:hypothetical protein
MPTAECYFPLRGEGETDREFRARARARAHRARQRETDKSPASATMADRSAKRLSGVRRLAAPAGRATRSTRRAGCALR